MTDTVDALARALRDNFVTAYADDTPFDGGDRGDAVAVLAALANAGYVVVRAEDVGEARRYLVQASIDLANGNIERAHGGITSALTTLALRAALATKETP